MPQQQRAERFLSACRRQPADCTPVWIMRQAGRYLPEYRKLREKHGFLEIARNPDLVATVTLMPLKRIELDAAIIFADIALPLAGIGVSFRLEENVGPVIDPPIRSEEQIRALREFDPQRDVPYVIEGITLVKRELAGKLPLIGFSGAPFTLASYLVEGRGKRDFRRTKTLMYSRPDLWNALMDRLTDTVIRYLRAQVASGAQALQLFDSWVGSLSPEDYERFVQPFSARIFREMEGAGVPIIHFGTDTATLLEKMAEAGGDVMGVDLAADRAGAGDPGEPRPLRSPRSRLCREGASGVDPAASCGPARAHLQPRTRHPSRHPGGKRPALGRIRPRAHRWWRGRPGAGARAGGKGLGECRAFLPGSCS